MSRLSAKALTISGLVSGLMIAAAATASADAFTPAIEEPVAQLGLLRGTPLNGNAPDGNSSSARPGRAYGPGYSDEFGGSGYYYDDGPSPHYGYDNSAAEQHGYWRSDQRDGR